MSDKYDEIADFLVRRTLELYRTPHVALDWEKMAKGEMANFLREAFPAPSGQGEDERALGGCVPPTAEDCTGCPTAGNPACSNPRYCKPEPAQAAPSEEER